MIGVDRKVPMIYDDNFIKNTESFAIYFRNKWVRDTCERLSYGYKEMSQINLTLAEMGLEQDVNDLYDYELQLTGCEQL